MGRRRAVSPAPTGGEGTPLTSLWPLIPEEHRRGLFLPPGYTVGSEALEKAGEGIITTTPVVPVAEIQDLDQQEHGYEVYILRRGELGHHVLPAQVLRDRRRVFELAARGVDVSSGTELKLIAFFREYLRWNLLPWRRQTRRLGWRPTEPGGVYLLDRAYPETEGIRFVADTEQAERFQAACRPRGELVAWGQLFAEVLDFPRVVVTCLAALVPPLRELLLPDVDSFWLHLVAPSSTGKTVAQLLACSLWADPFSEAWLAHGHATYAGVEELCLRVYGLPVFFEDVHLLRDEDRQRLIMGVGNQAFKARGGRRQQVQAPWRGVVISSGELPMIHAGSLGGEAARVLQLQGPPFGAHTSELGRLIDERLRPGLRAHHALVGRAVVGRLLALDQAHRFPLQARWEQLRAQFSDAAKGHPLLARQAGQWAALALAGEVLAALLQLEASRLTAAVEAVFAEARVQEIPSPAHRAHELLVAAIQSEASACHRWNGVAYEPPARYGRQVGVINEAKKFLACYRPFAEDLLRRQGFSVPSMVFPAMRDAGLLHADREHLTYPVEIGDRRVRMLRLPYPLEAEECMAE